MMKLLIPAVVVGALLASGAVWSISGKAAPAPNMTEVVLGCCGEPKPCDSCTCDETNCGDDCSTVGACCGDKAVVCCDDNGACFENGGPPPGCCEEKAACCGSCEGSACAEAKSCDEAKACDGEVAADVPAKRCCGGEG